MDIVTELQAALRQAVMLLRTHVEPAAIGGERFDLTDATEMRTIFAALQRAESDRCERVTAPDPAPRKAPIAFSPDTLAFPANGPIYVSAGLTKREYFAAMAMQGMLAGAWTADDMADYDGEPEAFREHQALVGAACVSYADALIAALAEPQP